MNRNMEQEILLGSVEVSEGLGTYCRESIGRSPSTIVFSKANMSYEYCVMLAEKNKIYEPSAKYSLSINCLNGNTYGIFRSSAFTELRDIKYLSYDCIQRFGILFDKEVTGTPIVIDRNYITKTVRDILQELKMKQGIDIWELSVSLGIPEKDITLFLDAERYRYDDNLTKNIITSLKQRFFINDIFNKHLVRELYDGPK